ncbi:flagellar hook-associated protein FlgK [Pseudophaeobacter arcticus]|jgi:flagellar hook-associated protein 1 FlgK|uniref:flagellar hook-associated protein FlgK n=1 Tax=Pseudophaeobacter arcticus TaxID=385492 RepID=UPI000487E578|nr:flagellar hook-associated protein FlgK [Pseudophaeobacter arcticus]
MSITSALNSAMTGLTANARLSQVTSENLANALTPGYSSQKLNLSTSQYAAGVRIGDVERNINPALQSTTRKAEAEYAKVGVYSDFYSRMSNYVGTVDDNMSISTQISNFDAALVEATSRPDSTERLHDLSVKAGLIVQSITNAADGLNQQRLAAESSIDLQVDQLNSQLKELEKLNARIVVAQATGGSTTAMEDQRDLLIDTVNQAIPVNVIQRDQGRVALFTVGGVALLDGRASELSFDVKRTIEPQMTQDNGLLSGLEINGLAMDTSITGPLRGGTLIAAFDIRDNVAVEAQNDLDAVARDLVERFQDPALDATIGLTDAGIFTDGGGAFDVADTVGLAARLELNDLIAMDGQAETWRLRDGLYAAAEGDPGDASQLIAYSDAISENRTVSTTKLGTISSDLNTLSASLMSRFARDSDSASNSLSYAATSYTELAQAELALGVDSDAELQNMMLIENAYAANARMLSTIDAMMESLLRI